VVSKAGFEYRQARVIEAVSLLCVSERAKQEVLPAAPQECDVYVERAYRDVRPGLARSTDSVARWVHGGPKPRV
jgi:hypothetical protein